MNTNDIVTINYERVTLDDCLELYKKKDTKAVINNGKIMNFKYEKEK